MTRGKGTQLKWPVRHKKIGNHPSLVPVFEELIVPILNRHINGAWTVFGCGSAISQLDYNCLIIV